MSITGAPLSACTMSPTRMPALPAGPSRMTPAIITPRASRGSWKARASSGVMSCGSMPNQPRRTAPVRTMSSITRRALSTGMAKPMPSEPPVSE
ncbi:Uncharacterised protein [Bordetella pertussis]|nr:hypothetical protein DK45_1 [Bordetella bronchiseptica]CFB57482.1 Uncharacterised protein [Bordetella pertussis]CFE04021.1 Uncharacterised protein [Bordetella pertussis]CFM03706.1 Uncharacterised protein [Bordetella pertussis]CFM38966.1 Uncharacterised protein [Bordetella pertussis]